MEGKSCRIVEYLDLQSLPDNSSYVPDLTQGLLQPCEVFDPEMDQLLTQLDVEEIVQNAEKLTQNLPQQEDNSQRFGPPVSEEKIQSSSFKRYYIVLNFCLGNFFSASPQKNFYLLLMMIGIFPVTRRTARKSKGGQ